MGFGLTGLRYLQLERLLIHADIFRLFNITNGCRQCQAKKRLNLCVIQPIYYIWANVLVRRDAAQGFSPEQGGHSRASISIKDKPLSYKKQGLGAANVSRLALFLSYAVVAWSKISFNVKVLSFVLTSYSDVDIIFITSRNEYVIQVYQKGERM